MLVIFYRLHCQVFDEDAEQYITFEEAEARLAAAEAGAAAGEQAQDSDGGSSSSVQEGGAALGGA